MTDFEKGGLPVGGVRFWIFSVDAGAVEIRIPDQPMDAEEFALFEEWVAMVMRVSKRRLDLGQRPPIIDFGFEK